MKLFKILSAVLLLSAPVCAQDYNLPPGKYPGNPKENFAPVFNTIDTTYRNIALNKPVYGSGSYDFNLTPQLIADGIIETRMPGWIVTETSNGTAPRNQREYLIDRHPSTRYEFNGNTAWVQVELAGNSVIPEVDGFRLGGSLSTDMSMVKIKPWHIKISASNDGKTWTLLKTLTGNSLPGDTLKDYRRKLYPINYRTFTDSVKLDVSVKYKFYRAEFNSPNTIEWRIAEFMMMNGSKKCSIGGPYNFSSCWKSDSPGEEWVYIDLGSVCSFNKIKLFWLKRAQSGSVQVSENKQSWNTIFNLTGNISAEDEINFDKNISGRYVRLLLNKAASKADGYILSEMEIYGTGALVASPHPQAQPDKNGNVILSGGDWKVQRTSFVKDDMAAVSSSGYDASAWITATVPGTVLISYLNAGMLPDPDFGDNQFLISDSYFYSDFIYRDEFIVPASFNGKRIFLNLDGINWKADLYINGKKAGRAEGAFTTGRYDVTSLVVPGEKNALAVYIYKNDNPGYVKEPTLQNHDVNGGELGADNPTFHTSVGWDWFPSVRGRNIGIWNEIYLSASGDVTIEHPFVYADLPLPDTTSADWIIQLALKNHSASGINGVLKGKIGDAEFEYPVQLKSKETKQVELNSSVIPVLHVINPRLWWPNGYGEANLYDVHFSFSADGKVLNEKEFKTGIREMSYSEKDSALRIWINGKRFISRGGNWGFSEDNLRYRSREYDIAVRYHKEMNLNMLRNWVGQTGDDEFFEACDKYGIVVWQDFWLANPGDGPNPNDHKMFLDNTEDFVKRIRNHPSIGLYCGRNEGYPPKEIDNYIRKVLPELAPGIHYISSSADEVVSGHGPYSARLPEYYFKERATRKFHSELGLPNPVSYESLKEMIPDSALWPINYHWGIHDFSMESAQEGAGFIEMLEKNFGKINNPKEWLMYAQLLNYREFRAVIEAQSKNRMGVLYWMTHPAWPSLVFQTYDYYFDPAGAFYGCKKASEPLHIQWNAFTDSVEVINYSSPAGSGLTASVQLINIDGTVKLDKKIDINCSADETKLLYKPERPAGLSDVYFIRLKLSKGNESISENLYWCGLEQENFKAIRNMPKTNPELITKTEKKNGKWFIIADLYNNTKIPAFMIEIKTVKNRSGERILPVFCSDSYITLFPGEKKTVAVEVNVADTNGETPVVIIDGVNIK